MKEKGYTHGSKEVGVLKECDYTERVNEPYDGVFVAALFGIFDMPAV
jgi:hypothetical protein